METAQSADQASTQPSADQRRQVTVLFCDVGGSSGDAERLEAEEYAELLDEFRRLAHAFILRHGGSIARLQGDGVLALFVSAGPRDDDGRRATEAALDLHLAVARLRAGHGDSAKALQMRSGIHAGQVLLTEGDIERGRLDVVGQVPNTAARLCSLASGGEILVSEETLGPQAAFFHFSAARRLQIKGHAVALSVLRIEGRATLERRIDAAARRGMLPFAGRRAMLARLVKAAAAARDGSPAVTVLSGEPGIGKTRLLDEFRQRLDPTEYHVLQGTCDSGAEAEAFQPFKQGLRGALGWHAGATQEHNDAVIAAALDGLGAQHANTLAPLAPLAQILSTNHGSLLLEVLTATTHVTAIVELIALLARGRTLVVLLDDWHWADDASRQVLEALRARGLPLMLVLATQTGADGAATIAGPQTLRLQPLKAAEAVGAINACLPGCESEVARKIYRYSGGSPLVIEELCHAAAADAYPGAIPRGAGVGITALVAARLARLPEPQAECLRMAAVAGYTFPTSVLLRLADYASAASTLEALAAQGFLVLAEPPGMLRFKHALTREAVYATIEPERRHALDLRETQYRAHP